jgi:hypothetical protein
MSCLYCVATHTLFFFPMGHIFYFYYYFLFIYLFFFFFENHGLGLGTALFRLGTRVSPAMQKNFNLPWKFFQMVGENWGLKLVKPPLSGQTWFGNSSKRSGKNWDLTLVDTGGKSLKLSISFFYFPRYRPPFGECCVCSSISFPFRDTSCVCVGTCVRVCV